jgi:hypothetical protein
MATAIPLFVSIANARPSARAKEPLPPTIAAIVFWCGRPHRRDPVRGFVRPLGELRGGLRLLAPALAPLLLFVTLVALSVFHGAGPPTSANEEEGDPSRAEVSAPPFTASRSNATKQERPAGVSGPKKHHSRFVELHNLTGWGHLRFSRLLEVSRARGIARYPRSRPAPVSSRFAYRALNAQRHRISRLHVERELRALALGDGSTVLHHVADTSGADANVLNDLPPIVS